MEELIQAALRARELAYAPYSHFAVGAAVMEAYGFDKSLTESEIVAELFKRYAELTKK